MPLQSRLFKNDPRLAKCLVDDSAHVLLGATGRFVGNIQAALEILDHAEIEMTELQAMKYGPSTAAAVLRYKQQRKIINYSYQTKADNIVGKMTIARLDRELVERDQQHPARFICGDCVKHSTESVKAETTGSVRTSLRARNVRAKTAEADSKPKANAPYVPPQLPANLGIVFHITKGAWQSKKGEHLAQIVKANSLLFSWGMRIVEPTMGTLIWPHVDVVDPRYTADVARVRRASDRVTPGFPNLVRVIVCPFIAHYPYYGATYGNNGGTGLDAPFILIDSNKRREDNCTMLHEMIHAAETRLLEEHHDPDPTNVFSTSDNRSVLNYYYAEILSRAFFAS
ncbi:hypothetical protein ETAA8_41800 [Anatilimnocola aggregata]|uniref:Uncharacterized protein n=1 Tax=Anatilimnocola aggregata TaxID=2528021 RepID=A0A517YFR3_9BACT|nr:hypothetical protein [Anatilimnocola aggregata]QDU29073.1 hypothetical protein ETAA8_41800 [Anatilimnocola aggregata]